MNFQEFKFKSGAPLCIGDLVHFERYAGEGSRETETWVGIITAFKAHKIKAFLPALNTYETVRNNVIVAFESGKDDMHPCSKASQILRKAAPVVKKLAEQYTNA